MKKNLLSQADNEKQKRFIYLFLILVLAIITFSNSVRNGFVSYDDTGYILENPLLKNLSFSGLKDIFSTYVMGNYHPLTILSDAILYHFFRLNPLPYHVLNIILHLLNIVLVYYFIFLLTKKNEVAAIVTCFFAIHPVHAETVNWIADLKDLLYTFFYLASLIFYLKYILQSSKNSTFSNFQIFKFSNFYFLCLLFFILSLLSKPSAISLPLILILIDYYIKKENLIQHSAFSIHNFFEKLPFFLLSITFGIVAIYAQKSVNAFSKNPAYNLFDRICLPFYEIVHYLFILFIPVGLSVVHPLPLKLNSLLPLIYYLSPLIFIALIVFLIWIIKKYLQFSKIIVFGFLFFLITIFPLLQIKIIGFNIISERYTYLPYLGILFIIAELFYSAYLKFNIQHSTFIIHRTSYLILLTSIFIFFSVLTFQRNKVWANSVELYTDAINKNPDDPFVYNNRGNIYSKENKYDEAIEDFSKALILSPGFSDIYYNRALTYNVLHKYNEAINDFTKAISLKPDFSEAYSNRGLANYYLNNFEDAINDFNKALSLTPGLPEAYNNLGVVYNTQEKFNLALENFSKAVLLKPDYAEAYKNRGFTYHIEHMYDNAIKDYDKAISLKPDFSEAYLKRGNSYFDLKEYSEALNDYKKYTELEPGNYLGYLMLGFNHLELKDYENSLIYFKKTIEYDKSNLYALFGLVFVNIEINNLPEARNYLNSIIVIVPEFKNGKDGLKFLESKGYTWSENNKIRLNKMFQVLK